MSRSRSTRPDVFAELNIGPADMTPSLPVAAPDDGAVVQVSPAKVVKNIVKTSVYLPPEVHDVLREVAFHERNKVHDLLLEGIDHILKTRRHPSISELTKRNDA